MEREMKTEKQISERQLSLIVGVSRVAILTWRRSGLIPPELWTEKRYPSGQSRFFYDKDQVLEWYKNLI